MKTPMTLPEIIRTEDELIEVMTRPSEALKAFVSTLEGPMLVLGAGGKMGPTLCVRARRAAEATNPKLEIVAVSRFTDSGKRQWLEERDVRTVACDLMDRAALATLPDASDIIYLVGLKFGTQEHPERTWAVNTLIPERVAERYAGARIVALSTGNVYPLAPVEKGGSVESDPLTPVGEYANAAVARERIFEYFSKQNDTPMVLVRLNYALDLRYGVLVDLARKIKTGEAIDVTMGYLNCIWQGDANDMILRALDWADRPPMPLNVTSPAIYRVRDLARRLGALMDRPVEVTGTEADTALLSDPSRACEALGAPLTSIDTVLRWTAHWIERENPTLDKPTHFEVRDGTY